MSLISPTLPTVGDPRGPEEIDLLNAVSALLADYNGNIDNANLKGSAGITWSKLQGGAGFLAEVGSNADGAIRRGRSVTATEDSISAPAASAAYQPLTGTAGTNASDEVRDVVLPSNGLLVVSYQAGVKSNSASTGGLAALHLNNVQLRSAQAADLDAGTADEAGFGGTAGEQNKYEVLQTSPTGLSTPFAGTDAAFTAFPTTGQIVPLTVVWAAAGTYDVAVRYKTTGASGYAISAKDRRLWVLALGF